jgi:hypothetical protein
MIIDDTRFHVVWTSKAAPDQLISSHQTHQEALEACERVIFACATSDHSCRIGHYRISTSHAFCN